MWNNSLKKNFAHIVKLFFFSRLLQPRESRTLPELWKKLLSFLVNPLQLYSLGTLYIDIHSSFLPSSLLHPSFILYSCISYRSSAKVRHGHLFTNPLIIHWLFNNHYSLVNFKSFNSLFITYYSISIHTFLSYFLD